MDTCWSALLATLPETAYGTILADPPWRFTNRTGKVSPEHQRLRRYSTLTVQEIAAAPLQQYTAEQAHCYLWVPNALLQEGLAVLHAWGFTYKTNLIWHKVRKDGQPDGGGVGFYFRNTTEMVLFGIRGKLRTAQPGRRQVNILRTTKREHSRKPEELYPIIEACSPGPYLELFARHQRPGWVSWGDAIHQGDQTMLIPLADQIAELEEVLTQRHQAYPQWARQGKHGLTPESAKAKIARLTAAIETLKSLQYTEGEYGQMKLI